MINRILIFFISFLCMLNGYAANGVSFNSPAPPSNSIPSIEEYKNRVANIGKETDHSLKTEAKAEQPLIKPSPALPSSTEPAKAAPFSQTEPTNNEFSSTATSPKIQGSANAPSQQIYTGYQGTNNTPAKSPPRNTPASQNATPQWNIRY